MRGNTRECIRARTWLYLGLDLERISLAARALATRALRLFCLATRVLATRVFGTRALCYFLFATCVLTTRALGARVICLFCLH